MQQTRSAWRSLISIGVTLLLAVASWLGVLPVWADTAVQPDAYVCDGSPLTATLYPGAVDDPAVPNRTAGTLPGAYVVLRSSELSLQLPRTNNAGAPSFTDGKWWWSLEDPDHPRFLQRRGLGDVQTLACERERETSGS